MERLHKTKDDVAETINWTKAWGKKYPILLKYQNTVSISKYAKEINGMLDDLQDEYNFNEQDSMLVLKDILYNVWKSRKKRGQIPKGSTRELYACPKNL